MASFFLVDETSVAVMAFGFLLMLIVAVIIGGINGVLIRYGRFTPVAATLAMYIALGGLSFVLRDRPGGFMSSTITGPIMAKLGPVPWAFIVLVADCHLDGNGSTEDGVGSDGCGRSGRTRIPLDGWASTSIARRSRPT